MAHYSVLTIKKLFGLSMNQCAFPGCEKKLVKPEWHGALGEICHIRAASPKGPRYVANMTDEERYDYDNLVLMCPTHHAWIDRLQPEIYTIDALLEMKAKVEESAMMGEKAMLEDLNKDDPSLVERAVAEIIAVSDRYYSLDPLPPMTSPAYLAGRVGGAATVEAKADVSFGGLKVDSEGLIEGDSARSSGVESTFTASMGTPSEDVGSTTIHGEFQDPDENSE